MKGTTMEPTEVPAPEGVQPPANGGPEIAPASAAAMAPAPVKKSRRPRFEPLDVRLADGVNGQITATLNEKEAKGGYEVLTLELIEDALFTPWREKLQSETAQPIPFCDWLRRNRISVVDPDSRELVADLAQIRLSVGTEIDIGKGAEAINGVKIKTKIQGVEKTDTVALPESFTLQLKAFEESKKSADLLVEMVLSPAPNNIGVQVELVCPQLAGFIRDQVKAVVDDVKARLKDQAGVVFALGKPGVQEWTRNAK